jgi:hypothetical protein
MTMPRHRAGFSGFTLAEVALGTVVFAIIVIVLINHLSINYATTLSERDRVFGFTKAQSILSEIQGYVDRGQVEAAVDLDVIDDGAVNNPVLTIRTRPNGTPVAADSIVSGNYLVAGGQWAWSRRITVRPLAGLDNRNARYVTVRIFKRNQSNQEIPVADLSAVINSAGDGFPTTQVFDVYLVAIENIPGWWVYMDAIRPFVESAITDLEARNPGLEVRTHWITKSSFGRNQAYRPRFNDAVDSWQTIPSVYFYPSRMPAGSASAYYYVPDNVRGRIDVDGNELHGYDADLNPHPYALADFFNHSMRHPEELALWRARVDAVLDREQEIADAIANGNAPPPPLDDMSKEPTLRLFLEDLNTSPLKYKNTLIINLHGELLPMPPLRNFADPAKSPSAYPEIRVVTHPEELRTRNDSLAIDDVRFRVYGFNSQTTAYMADPGKPRVLPVPIAVEVMGVDLMEAGGTGRLDPAVQLECLAGGVMVGTTADYQPFSGAIHQLDGPLPDQMHYTAEFVDVPGEEKFTRIYLHNTPVVAPPEDDDILVAGAPVTRGLYDNERAQLYWMSYVPCSCDTDGVQDFSRDLHTPGDGPKNTARWRFRVPAAFIAAGRFIDVAGASYVPAGDVLLQVRTRIWTDPGASTSGSMWPVTNDPDNLSTTWAWWSDSRDDVPFTERAQFQGDPRHCPYKDVLNGDSDFGDGYNWDLDTLANAAENSIADYPGLLSTLLRNRWRGRLSCDVGRIMEVWRKGLVGSGCVYTTLTGFSYYYVGLGNDIGYDSANGYPNSIPIEFSPLGTPGTLSYLNTITSSRRFVRDRQAPYWFGIPWLGELYPDWAYTSQWLALDGAGRIRGNLDSGDAATSFYQVAMQTAYSGSNRTAYGTALTNSQQRTNAEGCTSFFNIGTNASTFHHQSSVGTGTLTASGTEIATNYNFTMPSTAAISRPFGIATNATGTVGDEFAVAPYLNERFTATVIDRYYTHPNGNVGSGLVGLTDPADTSAAFIVINGIDNSTSTGTTFIGKWAVLSLVHSFFAAGDSSIAHRIKMPARVEIQSPNDISEIENPDQIAITFAARWQRWDGLPYTGGGTYGEDESELEYAIYYSNDGGAVWHHIQDGSPGTPGTRPPDPLHLVADSGPGDETFTWDVPSASFPEGSYLLRIDCFRAGSEAHYSYHKSKFFLGR